MKKILILAMCAVLVLAAFTGCKNEAASDGQTSQPQKTEEAKQTDSVTEESQEPEEKKVEIAGDISFWGGAHLTNVSEIVLESFAEQHPDLNLTYEKYPFAEYPTKMKLQLSANETDPDIMLIHDFLGQQFIKAGWLKDITDEIKTEDLIQNYQSTIMDGGRLYGLPLQATVMTFMYRSDVFSELGLSVPTNYEEYLAVGESLKQAGYYLDAYNPAVNAQELYRIFLVMLGGDVYDAEGNFVLNTEAGKGVETLKMIDELMSMGYLHESAQTGSDEYWTALNAGEIAAIYAPAFKGPYLYSNLDPEGNGGYGKWVMAAPPKLSEDGREQYQFDATFYVINNLSDNADVALEVIKYLSMSVEAAKTFTSIDREGLMAKIVNNYKPALEDLAADSAPWAPFGEQKVTGFIAQTLLDYEPEAPYKDTRYSQAQQIIDQYISAYFTEGNMTPEDTIAKIEEEASKLENK